MPLQDQIVLRVPPGTKDELAAVAARNDRTVSQEIRRLIREMLERETAATS